MEKLYLCINSVHENQTILPLETTVILHILKYCRSKSSVLYKVYLVVEDSQLIMTDDILSSYQMQYLEVVAPVEVPVLITLCELPLLDKTDVVGNKRTTKSGFPILLSGLCGVLRSIVKHAHGTNPIGQFSQLLGHKECCLKACAEVSAWTKFCEVDVPWTTAMLLCQKDDKEIEVALPEYLLKLEKHLETPVKIANISKRLHKLAVQKERKTKVNIVTEQQSENIVDNFETSDFNCRLCSNAFCEGKCQSPIKQNVDSISKDNLINKEEKPNEPSNHAQVKLEHVYAEGADMTLTDLILFYSLHPLLKRWEFTCSNFCDALPLVTQWYTRMKKVLKHSGPEQLEEPQSYRFQFKLPERAHTLELDIRDVTSHKLKVQKNVVDAALEKIKQADLAQDVVEHPRKMSCQLDWKMLPSSVHPCDGELPEGRSERKCQQLESMLSAIKTVAKDGDTIVDFCSGGGHLGILVAQQLTNCKVILVENKEESLHRAVFRIEKLGLENITVCQCNLGYFCGSFDVGTCLHACGTATDLVMDKCVSNRAAFVICPCCYGFIKDTHTVSFPRSQKFSHHAHINKQQYYQLGRAADQTQINISQENTGKCCMAAIDSDRSLFAMQHGYDVSLCVMEPPTCSPKNHILVGHIS